MSYLPAADARRSVVGWAGWHTLLQNRWYSMPQKTEGGKGQRRGLPNQLRRFIRFGFPCFRIVNAHAPCLDILFAFPYRGYDIWMIEKLITWCHTLILPACDALRHRHSTLPALILNILSPCSHDTLFVSTVNTHA